MILPNDKFAQAFVIVPKPSAGNISNGIPAFVNGIPQAIISDDDILADTGSPLDLHPDWELINNEQGGNDHFGWRAFGQSIVAFTNSGASVQNLGFKGIHKENGIIKCSNVRHVTADSNWTIAAAKFLNENNIIGCRVNNDLIEIVQRRIGTWNTLESVPYVQGSWEVSIQANLIELRIAETLILSATHQITGVGYWGISGHNYVDDNVILLTNFNVL